jgi:predicted transcriptional regulator
MSDRTVRRSFLDIEYELMEILDTGETMKTHIMFACKSSWVMTNKLLADLEKKGLIVNNNGKYELTETGKACVPIIKNLRYLLGEYNI